jgi:hypothetical protein
MKTSNRVTDAREKETPVVVDVDELHTPEYETNPVTVEEEKNPSTGGGEMEEDPERMEFDTLRGQGK